MRQSRRSSPEGNNVKILTQSLLLTLSLCVTGVAAADDFDVLKSMSVADFRAAGLDKLSDPQLKALSAWFADYQKQHACASAAAAGPVQPAAAAETPAPDYISARIAGDFTGWRGTTRFTLDNGQVWEQVDDSTVTVGQMTNPRVTISRGAFNAYYMSVEGVTDSVQVKRVKP